MSVVGFKRRVLGAKPIRSKQENDSENVSF